MCFYCLCRVQVNRSPYTIAPCGTTRKARWTSSASRATTAAYRRCSCWRCLRRAWTVKRMVRCCTGTWRTGQRHGFHWARSRWAYYTRPVCTLPTPRARLPLSLCLGSRFLARRTKWVSTIYVFTYTSSLKPWPSDLFKIKKKS